VGYLNGNMVGLLDHLKYVYRDTIDGMPTVELIKYNEAMDAEYIHNTTAIEGNRLGIMAVKALLKKPSMRSSIWGVTEREFDEVLNYVKTLEYRRSYVGEINLEFIKKLHENIMKDILELPGEFRTHNNIYISGVDKILTPCDLIEDELTSLIKDYYLAIGSGANVFEWTMWFHYAFESVHPFLDGNGRTGREILNYMLTNSGYPMMLFTGHRMEYLSLLRLGDFSMSGIGNLPFRQEMMEGFVKMILRDYGIKC
jgi:Fic family protein